MKYTAGALLLSISMLSAPHALAQTSFLEIAGEFDYSGSPEAMYSTTLSSCQAYNATPQYTCEQQAAAAHDGQQEINDCRSDGGTEDDCLTQGNDVYVAKLASYGTTAPTGDTSGSSNSSPTNTSSSGSSNPDTGLVCEGGTCGYTLLEPLPGLPTQTGKLDSQFYDYLNGIIMLLIIIGAMLAVVRFSIGGIMYMTSDIANTRAKAKSQMWACIWGLLLLISSVLILNTINPAITKLTLFENLQILKTPPPAPLCTGSGC